jgi:hypothetical protein
MDKYEQKNVQSSRLAYSGTFAFSSCSLPPPLTAMADPPEDPLDVLLLLPPLPPPPALLPLLTPPPKKDFSVPQRADSLLRLQQ